MNLNFHLDIERATSQWLSISVSLGDPFVARLDRVCLDDVRLDRVRPISVRLDVPASVAGTLKIFLRGNTPFLI